MPRTKGSKNKPKASPTPTNAEIPRRRRSRVGTRVGTRVVEETSAPSPMRARNAFLFVGGVVLGAILFSTRKHGPDESVLFLARGMDDMNARLSELEAQTNRAGK